MAYRSLLELLARLLTHLAELDRQVPDLEQKIRIWHREDEASSRLQALPGIGPVTANELVGSIGNAKSFKSGRQLAAWIGLVPWQHSSDGKERLLGVSKRSDMYLRTLLIHGARAVLRHNSRRSDGATNWLGRLAERSTLISLQSHWPIGRFASCGHC